MPIGYVINSDERSIKSWLHHKADLIFAFEKRGSLGRFFIEKGAESISMTHSGKLLCSSVERRDEAVRPVAVLNYLFYRKFMVYYHFQTTGYSRRRESRAVPDYVMKQTRKFASANRDKRRAYRAMEGLESDIRSSVIEFILKEGDDYHRDDIFVAALMDIAENLYYGYMDHIGVDRVLASIYQSRYHYIVINLLLKYGITQEDIGDDGLPANRLITILCRLFNESIVHMQKPSLPERLSQIEKAIQMIKEKRFGPEDYMIGGCEL